MAWGKVDDKLHASVKWRRATKGGRALWTTALSWCSDQENGGQVPSDMLRVLDGTPSDAKSLVTAGLWDTTHDGWEFHDWADYNPDSASAKAVREAKSDGGKQGNHARWHVKRKVKVAGCEFCESHNPSHTDRISESGPNRPGGNPPDPTRPDPSQPIETTPPTADAADPKNGRDDINELCTYLSEHLDALSIKHTVNKAWRDAARLMLDNDGRTPAQVKAIIDFALGDDFWRGNVHSMPTVRKQFDKLRLKMQQGRPGNVASFRPRRDVGVDQWLA